MCNCLEGWGGGQEFAGGGGGMCNQDDQTRVGVG